MDTSDVIRLVLLGLTVLLSAFFAGSEAAFLSVQRSRIAALILDKVKGAERVERLATHPEKLLPTVLTGNNLVNVAAAALGTTLAGSYLSPNWAVGASIGGVTVLLLLFGEIRLYVFTRSWSNLVVPRPDGPSSNPLFQLRNFGC